MQKSEHYKELLKRMNLAHNAEYYLEASWFAYTIIEDRFLSALRLSGGETYSNNRPIRMLGKKLEVIAQRKNTDALLTAYFSDELMNRVDCWKEDRNNLTHDMAIGTKTIQEIDKSAYILSLNAKKLIKDICSAGRLLKKNRSKV